MLVLAGHSSIFKETIAVSSANTAQTQTLYPLHVHKTTDISFVSAVKQTGANLYRSLFFGVQLRVTLAFPFSSSLNTLVMFLGPLTWKSYMLQEKGNKKEETLKSYAYLACKVLLCSFWQPRNDVLSLACPYYRVFL